MTRPLTPLINIPEKEAICPNARILLSQIMAAKGDTGTAERYLNEAANISKGEMLSRVHLLMGYLYFEKGEFLKAHESFFKIDAKSSFYRYARFGAAWSDIRMGLYDRALSLPENIGERAALYDNKELEMRLAVAYSNYRLGRLKEAKDGFLGALKDLRAAEEELRLLAEGNSLKRRYSMRIANMETGKLQAGRQ